MKSVLVKVKNNDLLSKEAYHYLSVLPGQDGNFRETEIERRKKERHIIVQLTLIVGSFILGYIPPSG